MDQFSGQRNGGLKPFLALLYHPFACVPYFFDNRVGLLDHGLGHVDDAGGDAVDFFPRLPAAAAKHLGDGQNLLLDLVGSVFKALHGMGSDFAHLPRQAGDDVDAILQQGGVCRVVNVGLHDRRIDAPFAMLQHHLFFEAQLYLDRVGGTAHLRFRRMFLDERLQKGFVINGSSIIASSAGSLRTSSGRSVSHKVHCSSRSFNNFHHLKEGFPRGDVELLRQRNSSLGVGCLLTSYFRIRVTNSFLFGLKSSNFFRGY